MVYYRRYCKSLLQRLIVPLASVCLWLLHTNPTGLRFHLEKMAQNEMKTGLVEEKLIYKTHLKYHDREVQFAIMVPPHILIYCSMQGWRSGESTRLPPMWPRFDSQIWRHMWVEFVGSLLCTERFSPGTPVSPLLKNHHLTWFVLIVNLSLQWKSK